MPVLPNTFDRLWNDCSKEALSAVARVGQSGWYILGSEVATFEEDLAKWCGVRHVVGVANGMDAIEIGLRIAGIGTGDKVLTTSLSAFPTALAIIRAGATPIYCDVDMHGLIDPDAVESAFAAHPDIRCIAPVHLYGHLADMDALQSHADQHGACILEDAAQAIGARRDDCTVASGSRSATLSFYPTKNLGAIGDGGALLLHDDEQAQAARELRNYGQTAKYIHDVPGLNSRLDEVHAAVLKDAFLPRLTRWIEKRRAIAHFYLNNIDNPYITLLPGPDPDGSVWHLFPVLVVEGRRQDFLDHLAAGGVVPGLHYPVLMPEQKAVTDMGPPLVTGDLVRAKRYATCEVSLPIHPYLTEEEQVSVVGAVNSWTG